MIASVKFDIPEELASRLIPLENQLTLILELGLREFNAVTQPGFKGAAEVLEFLANLPSPEEIIKLRPSNTFQARISHLLTKNRTKGLTPEENLEWEQISIFRTFGTGSKGKSAVEN